MSIAVTQAVPPTARRAEGGSSYGVALKSTVSIGGASVVNILLGIIRTKCVAVMLGPAGVGLMGAYGSITALVSAVAGMGIQNSGVRQIAEASGGENTVHIARVTAAVRRATLLLGVVGALAMVAFSPFLSAWTFGNRDHAIALAILGVTILFGSIAGGEMALIQGMRRIGDLVRVNLAGSILGTLVSVPLVWWLGIRGIVPFLVTVSALAAITAWWYARRVPVQRAQLSWGEALHVGWPLLRLGFVFMATGILSLLVAYLLRIVIVRRLGIEAAGQYQAASNLASIYVGFVLTAMGTDFYPRLTAAASDHVTLNRMVNEQAEVSLLLAAPGIVATLALAPMVIALFYSGSFQDAVAVLRWQVLGILLRVVSWPFGFAVLAKGHGKVYFWTELAGNVFHLGALWMGVVLWGLPGTGIAFAMLYVFYWTMMYWVVRRTTGFGYAWPTRRVLFVTTPLVAAAFAAGEVLPGRWAAIVTFPIVLVLGWYCGTRLVALVPESRPARVWNAMWRFCGFSQSNDTEE